MVTLIAQLGIDLKQLSSTEQILTYVTIIFALIGLIGTAYRGLYVWIARERFSWKDFDKLVKCLIKKMARKKYYPDAIVTIGRGGAILGATISGNLPHPDRSKSERNIPILGCDRDFSWEEGVRHESITSLVSFC